MEKLDFDLALRLARRLATIDNFPRYDEAFEAVADDLVEICQGSEKELPEDQAVWLVEQARRQIRKWGSSADLRDLYRSKYKPSPENQVYSAELYGPPDLEHSSRIINSAIAIIATPEAHRAQINAMRYQAIRDCLYYIEGDGRFKTAHQYDYWQPAMDRHNREDAEEVAILRTAIDRGDLAAVPPLPEYSPEHSAHSLTQSEFESLKNKQQENL